MKAKRLITALLLIIFLTYQTPTQRGKTLDAWEIVKVGIITTMGVFSIISPKKYEFTEREMEILLKWRRNNHKSKSLTCTEQVILIVGAKRFFHKLAHPKEWYNMIIGGARSGGALTDSEMLMVDEERPHKVPSKVAEIKKVITQTLGKP